MKPLFRVVGLLVLLGFASLVCGVGYSTVTLSGGDSVSPWDLSRTRLDCDDPYTLSSETQMICVARNDGWDDVLDSARSGSMARANTWSDRVAGSGQVFGALRSTTLPCLRAYVLASSHSKVEESLPRSATFTHGAAERVVVHSDDVNGQPPRRRVGASLFRVYTGVVPGTAGMLGYAGVRAVDGRLAYVGATSALVLFDGIACGPGDRDQLRRQAEDLLGGVQIRDAGCLDTSKLVVDGSGPKVPLTRVCLPRIPDVFVDKDLSDDNVDITPGTATNVVYTDTGDPALDSADAAARLNVSVLQKDIDDGLPDWAALLKGETEQDGPYTWSCAERCRNGYYYAKVLTVSKSQKVVVSVRCNAAATTSGACTDSFARLVQKAKVLR